jgi:hypothetical protein
VIEITLDGYRPVSKTFVAREGGSLHEEVVLFENARIEPASEVTKSSDSVRASSAATVTSGGDLQRTLGYLVGGAGIVGLGLGVTFGLLSKSTYNDASAPANCPTGPASCNDTGVSGGEKAHEQATISTVAFVAGGALVGGGIALYLTAPKDRTTSVVLNGTGLQLRGKW